MAVLERDYRIDGIKWLLIVLVTFGHVIEPALSNLSFPDLARRFFFL